jgi:PEP-CTERM motif
MLVALPSQAATVYLQLFPLTGEVRLENRAATPFSFIFYSIDSTNTALDPTKWTSIADTYDASGNGFIDPTHEWNKLSTTSSELAEGAILPGAIGMLPPYRSIGLGRIWNPNTVPVDYLSAQVKQPDGSDADVTKELAIDGNYAHDNIVDQTDYSFWTNSFGSTTFPYADGNHNGIVDAADYVIWRKNLGAHLVGMGLGQASGGGGLAAAAVPEPGSVMLMLVAGGALASTICFRRRRLAQ